MKHVVIVRIATTTGLVLLLAACTPASEEKTATGESARVDAVATIYPVAQLLSEIGGERVSVSTLLPPGASPHAYEPIPSDLVRLARAALLVRVGGGIDTWTRPLLAAGGNDPREVVLYGLDDSDGATSEPRARDGAPERDEAGRQKADRHETVHHGGTHREPTGEDASQAHGHAHGHAHTPGADPHVWLDPMFAADHAVPALAAALIELDPVGGPYYEARRDDLIARLKALDATIRGSFAGLDTRDYISFHSAWGRFAARYGLRQAGVVEEAGGEEPTPREIGELIRAARASRVGAILVEPQMSARVAEIIAAEFGGRTVLVDPLGDPNDAQRASYVAMMTFNAGAFARAMSGDDS